MTKAKTVGAVHTHTHTSNFNKIIKKEMIEYIRENYANIPFNINSSNNFLFLHARIVIKERKGCA